MKMDKNSPNGSVKNRNNQQVRSLGLVLRSGNSNIANNSNNKPKVPKKGKPDRSSVVKQKSNGELVEGTFVSPSGTMTVRKIEPAKEYNVLSVARAMNPDLAKGVKDLFDPELEAAQLAIQSGLYISWRPRDPPYDRQDCQRVGPKSRCFCDHLLEQHENFTGIQTMLKCEEIDCVCKAFNFIPSRPEELGEFWLRRRKNFDPLAYRCYCRCKHTHVLHNVVTKRCTYVGCGCQQFGSSSVCAACDQKTDQHETRMETEAERRAAKRPVGAEWLPFAEITTLKNMVLTGVDDGGAMERNAITCQSTSVTVEGASTSSVTEEINNSSSRALIR